MVAVAAARIGPAESCAGLLGYVSATLAHHAIYFAGSLGCSAQFSAHAGLAGATSFIRQNAARLAQRRCCEPQGQMGRDRRDVCKRHFLVSHRSQIVGRGMRHCLHGCGSCLVVAQARISTQRLKRGTAQNQCAGASNMDNMAASSSTGIPNSWALSSLLPASAPATTKLVFLLTEPATLAPAASSSSLA